MRLHRSSSTPLTALLALGIALAAHPLRAQTPSLLSPGPVVGTAPAAPPPAPAPPGLPGAIATTGTPAPPPGKENALSPTDALFDAINRGDLGAAREAIGRGAQLDAKNLLGMTPLELAVDLNRNGIAFLLLSIEHEGRAAASSAGASLALSVPPAPAAVPTAPAPARAPPGAVERGGSVAALLLAGQPAPGLSPVHSAPAGGGEPQASPPGGSGSPNPAIGFLGFAPAEGAAAPN